MKKHSILIVFSILLVVLMLASVYPVHFGRARMALVDAFRAPLSLITITTYKIADLAYFEPLKRQNRALQRQIGKLTKDFVESREVLRENARLKDLLLFKAKVSGKAVPAVVIGRDPSAWEKTVLLNVGRNSGVEEDAIVSSSLGLVGRIAESGKDTSKVMLLTDPDSRVACVTDRTRAQGVLVGSQSGDSHMIYIGLDDDVEPEDKIFTSGLGGIFPKGLLVGQVREVRTDRIRLYKTAVIRLSQDPSRLEEVICIK